MSKHQKYLYGASVQGIQSFIFQTNKLKEIVGASELVAQICTTAFDDFEEKAGISIVRAAGNIKYIFETKAACKKAMLEFPRKVMAMAPGITISQAVVLLEHDNDYDQKSNELEKLLRVQRNKVIRPLNLGLNAIKRAPSTGLPGVEYVKKENGNFELIDEASRLKTIASGRSHKLAQKAFKDEVDFKKLAFNFDDITDKNNWLAVVHADGNGLGNIFQIVGKNYKDMQNFSTKLDEITKLSARYAFQRVESRFYDKTTKIPFRPVVLSGDDLTVICRADLALEYTQLFLEEFERISIVELNKIKLENETCKNILSQGLTACAGIAFIKATYPFHYAVNLAESLCKRTKEKAKALVKNEDSKLPPSCLMFYKVQDSFITDIKEIVARTLTPQDKISLEFGPYYCGKRSLKLASQHPDCHNTINELIYRVHLLDEDKGKAIKSNLRQWLTLLFDDEGKANQRMIQIERVGDKAITEELNLLSYTNLRRGEEKVIPFYDLLSIASLNVEIINNKQREDK